jgi:hypothetical protein
MQAHINSKFNIFEAVSTIFLFRRLGASFTLGYKYYDILQMKYFHEDMIHEPCDCNLQNQYGEFTLLALQNNTGFSFVVRLPAFVGRGKEVDVSLP